MYECEQGTIIGPKAFSLEEGVPELFRFFGGAVVAAASFSAWWNRVPWKGPFKRAEMFIDFIMLARSTGSYVVNVGLLFEVPGEKDYHVESCLEE